MTKPTISSIKFNNIVSLSVDDDNDSEFKEIKEAVSSTVSDNVTISWTKFILTDDLPNENKVRVPQSEFSNLIRTGTYMPFKMAYKEPKNGHEDSFPLGVIAQLKQSGNQIVALAALWRREREEDIQYLKTCIAEKKPVNVSWEILHEDSAFDENGIEDLIGTSLRAVTIVGRPAYAGRTPVLNVASKNGKQDINSEDNTLDELEKLQTEVNDLKATLAGKETELAEKEALISEKESELVPLREFKASAEAEAAKVAQFNQVKDVFKNAGIEKPDTYFEENKDKLLNMDQASLEFMVQELVAFSSTEIETENASEDDGIPDLTRKAPKELDIKELAELLRKGTLEE